MIYGSIINKLEWGMVVDLPLAWEEFWCANFLIALKVLDYSNFKGVKHCLKTFFPTNWKLMGKGEVQQPAPVFSFSFSLDFCIVFRFVFYTSNQLSEFSLFVCSWKRPIKRRNVLLIFFWLLLLSPFTINSVWGKILKAPKHLRSDLIKIERFNFSVL